MLSPRFKLWVKALFVSQIKTFQKNLCSKELRKKMDSGPVRAAGLGKRKTKELFFKCVEGC